MKIVVLTRREGLQKYYRELVDGDFELKSVSPDENQISIPPNSER